MTRTVSSRRQFLQRGGLGAALSVLSPYWASVAAAHRSQVTLTRLRANLRSSRWEIEHAIHYHDAATALRRLAPGARLDPTTPAGQARLMLAIEQQILWSRAEAAMVLEPIGAELVGDSLRLYQQCDAALAGTRIAIKCEFLHDVFSDQVNRFSIELSGSTTLLTANAASPRLEFKA